MIGKIVAGILIAFFIGILTATFDYSFAMHDSTLDVNTWNLGNNTNTSQAMNEPLPFTSLESEPLEFTVVSPNFTDNDSEEETKTIEQPSQYQWAMYDDLLLQFSVEHPSNWTIEEYEDMISFEIPDTDDDFNVIVEPILEDHSDYARDTLNERRSDSEGFELIGLNETSINGQPATIAQYHTRYLGGSGVMSLSYFMVTNDFTGYRLLYQIDDDEDTTDDYRFPKYLPLFERFVESFRITR
jgi:hypothetical protein